MNLGGGGGHKLSVHCKCEQCTVDVVFDPSMSFSWPLLLKAFLVLFHLSKMRNITFSIPENVGLFGTPGFLLFLKSGQFISWLISFMCHFVCSCGTLIILLSNLYLKAETKSVHYVPFKLSQVTRLLNVLYRIILVVIFPDSYINVLGTYYPPPKSMTFTIFFIWTPNLVPISMSISIAKFCCDNQWSIILVICQKIISYHVIYPFWVNCIYSSLQDPTW